jgi:hypothetical protein
MNWMDKYNITKFQQGSLSNFFHANVIAKKPSFNEKNTVLQLRNVAFTKATTTNLLPQYLRIIELVKDTVDCADFFGETIIDIESTTHVASSKDGDNTTVKLGESKDSKESQEGINPTNSGKSGINIKHPWFWKALGFPSEDPIEIFTLYAEPRGGAGNGLVDGSLAVQHTNGKYKGNSTNAYTELPLSPLTSRFSGSALTLQCIIYLFETSPQVAHPILRQRKRAHVRTNNTHYCFVMVCIEIVRLLSILFDIIHTRTQSPPLYPIQPDTRVMVPFEVDWRELDPLYRWPLKPYWHLLSETNGFQRLFNITFLVYDTFYDVNNASISDTYTVLEETERFITETLGYCSSLTELENVIWETFVNQNDKFPDIKNSATLEKEAREAAVLMKALADAEVEEWIECTVGDAEGKEYVWSDEEES